MDFLGFLGVVLGPVMAFIYKFVQNYFLTIFLFTLIIRILLFPLSLKSQKSQMDRAKLAPKLERLQKKYANDRQKLSQKQQELYEKNGVSMTGGCLPLILSMVVLFGVIAAIYAPLSYLADPSMPKEVISVAQQAVISYGDELTVNSKDTKQEGKLLENELTGYYGQLRMMLNCDKNDNQKNIIDEINHPSARALQRAYSGVSIVTSATAGDITTYTVDQENYEAYLADYQSKLEGKTGQDYYDQINKMSTEFALGENFSLLDQPWGDKGFAGISWLWLIPLLSGATSMAVSFISMRYTKKSMPQNQPGQGCQNNAMLIFMPLFSTWIAFTVPGAVGIYWTFSNIISMGQTILLNKIYDPAKARAEAEAAYEARRKQKAEDKKRLAQARQRDEAEARKAEQEAERQREESRENNKKKKSGKGGAQTPSQNPNKLKARAEADTDENASAEEPVPDDTEAACAEPEADNTGKDSE